MKIRKWFVVTAVIGWSVFCIGLGSNFGWEEGVAMWGIGIWAASVFVLVTGMAEQ